MYGIIDFSRIDTDPGSPSAFAPPAGFAGDYLRYMRERWRADPGVRQRVVMTGWMIGKGVRVSFTGRYAKAAKVLVDLVRSGYEP